MTPAIPFFNARTDTGENYRVLFQAASPEGLSAEAVPQGQETEGKIYFDVTGAEPTSIVYNDAVTDRLVWDADALATTPGAEVSEGVINDTTVRGATPATPDEELLPEGTKPAETAGG